MKLPIPADWDNETWRCVQIQWPDSPYWIALLNGWLSQFARGRLWNEDTGSILDAMLTGIQIWERNRELTSCEGEPIPPLPPEIVTIYESLGGGCPGECEDDMPCIDLTNLLKIEDGKLYARNSCCEWEEIGPLAGAGNVETPPDDPFTPPGETPPTFYACGKAHAAATIVRDVATAIWEEFDAYPWEWIKHVEQDVNLDLDNGMITLGVMQAIQMEAIGYTYAEVVSNEVITWLKCQLLQKFADNADRATESDFESAKSLMKGHMGADIFQINFWDYVFAAIGWRHFANAAQAGAIFEGDCDSCEDTLDPGLPGDVYWSGVIVTDWKPAEVNDPSVETYGNRRIAQLTLSGATTLSFTDLQFRLGLVSLVPLASLTLRYRGTQPTNEWVTPKSPDLTDLQAGQVVGVGTNTLTVVGGSVEAGYIDVLFEWGSPTLMSFFGYDGSHSWRVNPCDIVAPWTISNATIEILDWTTA